MYQFIFSNLFPKFFGKFDNRVIQINIEFTSYYSAYLNQKNIIDWQINNQYWEEQAKKVKLNENDSNSNSDVEVIEKKKKNEDKEEEKRNIRKRKMEAKKKSLEEKLRENTEKIKKLKTNI